MLFIWDSLKNAIYNKIKWGNVELMKRTSFYLDYIKTQIRMHTIIYKMTSSGAIFPVVTNVVLEVV